MTILWVLFLRYIFTQINVGRRINTNCRVMWLSIYVWICLQFVDFIEMIIKLFGMHNYCHKMTRYFLYEANNDAARQWLSISVCLLIRMWMLQDNIIFVYDSYDFIHNRKMNFQVKFARAVWFTMYMLPYNERRESSFISSEVFILPKYAKTLYFFSNQTRRDRQLLGSTIRTIFIVLKWKKNP